jgi:hypothetical protein
MNYAKTLSELVEDKTMGKILDISQDMNPVYKKMKERWTRDLFERNPTPAYNTSGEYVGTNLDMASLLNVLAEREAVVNFPEYKPMRASNKKDKEWVVSNENRHGKILGLTAKKDAFSFSVRFEDQNVVDLEKNKTGKYRNFLITDLDGDFYNGAKTIEIPAYTDIVDFVDSHDVALRDYDLSRAERKSGSKVIKFENFVQPNLWQAFFSGDFIKTKALEKRLEDEGKYYRSVAARIRERLGEGKTRYGYKEPFKFRKIPETVPKEIKTLQAEVDMPEFEGRYAKIKDTEEGLEKATKMANEISYSVLPRLRFNTRAVELAFFKNGENGKLNPGWSVPEIERDYKIQGKRIEWNRIVVDDDIALRYRVWERTERVNPLS